MYSASKFVLQMITLCFIAKGCNGSILSSHVRTSRQVRGCVLPEHPEFGQWTTFQQTLGLLPGQIAPLNTILRISCRDNRILDGETTIVCLDGNWSSKIGQCLQTCPPRYNTSLLTVTCTKDFITPLKSCTKPVDGTMAQYKCADFYEDDLLENHVVHRCFNGKWNYPSPECRPTCGQIQINRPVLTIGGKSATQEYLPWHVAIYNTTDKNLKCGGSLLNQRVILTAAHCITDNKGDLLPKEMFTVAAGKYFRNFNDSRDFNDAQFSTIHEMYVPKQYHGEIQNYYADIAVLITTKTFVLSLRVQPVCVEWNLNNLQELLDPTKEALGYVSGWGYTPESNLSSSGLKKLETSIITTKKCSTELPRSYENFFTRDKLCGGFVNSSGSMCQGDSGGGLVIRYKSRFYLVGITSLSPREPGRKNDCDNPAYGLYTKVSDYIVKFIMEKEVQYRPEEKTCENDPSCNTALSVLPQKTCPQILSSSIMNVTCIYKNRETQNCTNAVSGTVARFKCAPFYEDLNYEKESKRVCQDGIWNSSIPQCVPVCGQKTVDATPLIINGTRVNKGDYPWQVAVYTTKDLELVCGGSLISQRVILTAAHCVTNDDDGTLLSKTNYIVAVGKYYRNFSDIRDHKVAQFSELEAIFTPEEYRGNSQNFLGDIAIIITKKTFTLSRRIQPVCLDSKKFYTLETNQDGFVTGWGFIYENSKPSDILKELKVSSVSRTHCRNTLTEDFEIYLTHDKFCAGYLNQKKSVCKGDSGGGLVFKHDGRYYITGIVSLSPVSPTSEGGCNSQQYTLYTKVSNYMTGFILQKMAEFKV